MAARAGLREHHLAASQLALSLVRYLLAARSILEQIRLRRLEKEQRDVRRLGHGCVPVARIFLGVLDPDRRDFFAAHQSIEMQQPFLAEQPDVDEHAIQRPEHADGIRTVF